MNQSKLLLVLMLPVAAVASPYATAVAKVAAPATPVPPPVETFSGEDPAVVARWVEHMRNNMTLGTYPDGTPLTPETPQERKQPIIDATLAQIIWERGVLSGYVEVCGGDWQVMSFDPLMADLKARGDLSPKQLGFAALLHGAAQEWGRGRPEEDCTPGFKASLSATLALSKQISRKYAKVG